MTREKTVDDTIAKLRFLCGSGSTYPVSNSVTNADVMVLIEAIDHLDRDVDKALTAAEKAIEVAEKYQKIATGRGSDLYIASVFYFPNGNVAVCDQFGQQMPEFQAGTGKEMQPLIDAQLAKQDNSAIIRGTP